MKNVRSLILFALLLMPFAGQAGGYELRSPDDRILVRVEASDQLTWSVFLDTECLLLPSPMGMAFSSGHQLGHHPVVRRTQSRQVDDWIHPVVPVKNRRIRDRYNELILHFQGDYRVEFRAYDHGVAYRFVTSLGERPLHVADETVGFHFEANHRLFWPAESSPTFQSHFENLYQDIRLNGLGADQYGALPFLVETGRSTLLLITEADLYDYPNLFLSGTGTNLLTGVFPPAIASSVTRGDRQEVILRQQDYLAATGGSRPFPWRVMMIAEEAERLLENELVFQLSSPNVIADTSWIRPGKVAWDWWNANNVYGVDFRAGINTDTYKYYIDFASEFGLEYIILDEGWSASTLDLSGPAPGLDLEELFAYAREKQVGIVLWVLWNALDRDLEATLDRFAGWGASGIKVDFMVRADQDMVNYYERVARAAAERQLLVNFHGAFKPVGLNRKYPNVLTYEGVRGLENHKWSEEITPAHNATLPFTRMVAGPMDYTPGAMINATKDNFRIRYTEPMSQGTRAHQAAMYVLYESPMQMLADNPSNYLREPRYTRFISRIPVVWDRSLGLPSEPGRHAAVAREKDGTWYIGVMTDWEARDMVIDTSFLKEGSYRLEFIEDGPNADRQASDHRIGSRSIQGGEPLRIRLMPGGGWLGILSPMHPNE
jgi:alpha-glucosidase